MKTLPGTILIDAGVAVAVVAGIVYFFQLMAAHIGGDIFKGIWGALIIPGLLLAAGIWLLRH